MLQNVSDILGRRGYGYNIFYLCHYIIVTWNINTSYLSVVVFFYQEPMQY